MKGDSILCRDDSNNNGSSPLMMRDTVLGVESTTRPYLNLLLRRYTSLLTGILGKKIGVDVTEEQNRGRGLCGGVLEVVLGQPQTLSLLGKST